MVDITCNSHRTLLFNYPLAMMERSFYVGIVILFNIGVLLFLFTCAIKVRAYKKFFLFDDGLWHLLCFKICYYSFINEG